MNKVHQNTSKKLKDTVKVLGIEVDSDCINDTIISNTPYKKRETDTSIDIQASSDKLKSPSSLGAK